MHLALQQPELAAGDQFEVAVGEGAGGRKSGRRGIELRELQLDALGDRARRDARGIELLHDLEHAPRRRRASAGTSPATASAIASGVSVR